MKLILSTALVLLSVATLADATNVQFSADQLLRNVVAQLPTDPIQVSCDLLVRKQRGIPLATFKVTLDAQWGATPPRACYTIHDAFGRALEKLTITHGQPPNYHHTAGDPLRDAPLEDLSLPIQKTDLSWVDLSLAFLWWPGGTLVGEESIRTFDCYIVEIKAPTTQSPSQVVSTAETRTQNSEPKTQNPTPYATVRLWISKKTHMMLQAEGYDAKGNIKRRLWVKSCKKINEHWMIKVMEIQHYPAIHRTKLRVTDVTSLNSELGTRNPEPRTPPPSP